MVGRLRYRSGTTGCMPKRKGGAPRRLPRFKMVVARRGVEPLISALKGRRPRPLDERATNSKLKGNGAGVEAPTREAAADDPLAALQAFVEGNEVEPLGEVCKFAKEEQKTNGHQHHRADRFDRACVLLELAEEPLRV